MVFFIVQNFLLSKPWNFLCNQIIWFRTFFPLLPDLYKDSTSSLLLLFLFIDLKIW